jgi:6-phosphogluconolactonase/glucosamine-6-phosphate isomerase/deaminase
VEYVYSTTSQDVIDYLSHAIQSHLNNNESVLWLLSGGSAIDTAITVARILAENEQNDLSRLSISLVDERYGVLGHPNENWSQLLEKGFSLPGADLHRPLIGLEQSVTNESYGSWLQEHITEVDFSIGLFGIGADGHTAGIKPHTTATQAKGWSFAYSGPDFERITMTFDAIRALDQAVAQVMGVDKFAMIKSLLGSDTSLDDQPAQVLKEVKESILFTDYKEDIL